MKRTLFAGSLIVAGSSSIPPSEAYANAPGTMPSTVAPT
jgi:hypothetical protein